MWAIPVSGARRTFSRSSGKFVNLTSWNWAPPWTPPKTVHPDTFSNDRISFTYQCLRSYPCRESAAPTKVLQFQARWKKVEATLERDKHRVCDTQLSGVVSLSSFREEIRPFQRNPWTCDFATHMEEETDPNGSPRALYFVLCLISLVFVLERTRQVNGFNLRTSINQLIKRLILSC